MSVLILRSPARSRFVGHPDRPRYTALRALASGICSGAGSWRQRKLSPGATCENGSYGPFGRSPTPELHYVVAERQKGISSVHVGTAEGRMNGQSRCWPLDLRGGAMLLYNCTWTLS